MAASNLDIEKFRKVCALIKGGATDGERSAAKARAEAMASRAGMTLQQAMSNLDGPKQEKPKNWFEDFEDGMERRHPGYKAEQRSKEAERQARYAARRSEILKQFGTIRAFMDPTEDERLLLKAGKPFVTKRSSYEDVCGTRRQYAKEFAGISGSIFRLKDVDPRAIEAIREAIPFPVGVKAAFDELRRWERLNSDRAHFYDHREYYFDTPIELRVELLRDFMRNEPVSSWEDLDARFKYKAYAWEQQWIDEKVFEDAEWSRLYADTQILRAAGDAARAPESDVQRGQRRTNADIRIAVLSMLDSSQDLSDREIARRVGVSPQTVSNWRKRHSSGVSS